MFEREFEAYEKVGGALIETLKEKRQAYGNNLASTGIFLAAFYPTGIPVAAYSEIATMIRVLDKLFRLANQHGHTDAGDAWKDSESPWLDIAGYGLATVVDQKLAREREKDNEKPRTNFARVGDRDLGERTRIQEKGVGENPG
ncbi:MAG: hypothetical protein KAY24_00260 [Candidatus Eisenbacteria sp.]|nr:hypothetical protein [Candidatus Eisenbacteria bacterium]